MKLIKYSIFALLFYFCGIYIVNASDASVIYEAEKIDNIYFYMHREDTDDIKYPTHNFHEQATFYRRSSDDKYVYCIEKWAKLTGATIDDYTYNDKSNQKTNISSNDMLEIELIGYFGYGYKDDQYDHTASYWYAITQYLIWQIQAPEIKVYFVNSLSSTTPLNIYQDEIKEIKALVQKAKTFPDFSNLNHTIHDELTINYNPSLLTYSKVHTSFLSRVRYEDNKIILKPIYNGLLGSIIIINKGNRFDYETIVYESEKYQDAILIGNFGTRQKSYSIKENYSDLTISTLCEKVSSYDNRFNYTNEYCNKEVSIYADEDIYNNANTLLFNKGDLIKKASTYKLYPAKYKIVFNGDNEYLSYNELIDLSNTLNSSIKKEISLKYQDVNISSNKYKQIYNVIDNSIKYSYEKGANFVFGLYTDNNIENESDNSIIFNKDDLITTITSNEEGNFQIDIDLPYGNYYIKELNDNNLYQENNSRYDITFIKADENTIQFIVLDDIYNDLNKGLISINIIDEDTKEPLSNITISIYDSNDTLIYKTTTNEDGLIELELPYNDYYIIQEDYKDDYIKNENKSDFKLYSSNESITITNKKEKENQITEDKEEVIIEGEIDGDGFIVDVPSTYHNDYSLIIYFSILIICVLGLKYEKNNN